MTSKLRTATKTVSPSEKKRIMDSMVRTSIEETSAIKTVAIRVADKVVPVEVGMPPRTDGKTIWLPFNDKSFLFEDLVGVAAHEGGHIRFKSEMNKEILELIIPSDPQLSAYILNMFEDFRVNLDLKTVFKGWWEELNKTSQRKCREIVSEVENLYKAKGKIGLEFICRVCTVLAYLQRDWSIEIKTKVEKLGSLIPFWTDIKKDFKLVNTLRTMNSSIISAITFAERLKDYLNESKSDAFKKLIEEILREIQAMLKDKKYEGEFGKLLKSLKSGTPMGKAITVELEEELKEESEAEKEEIEESLKRAPGNPRMADPKTKADLGIVPLDRIEKVEELMEWNAITNPIEVYQRIVEENRYQIDELRKYLENINGGQEITRNLRSGMITPRDLYKVVASKGKFDRPFNAYQKRRGAKVMIVIDESGSMEVDHKIENAKRAAIILAEALKRTRIKFGVIGFSAYTSKKRIAETVYKTFDENLDPRKLGTINCSNNTGQNRDGTSLELAAQKYFTDLSGDIPFMIVLSDGQPNHSGTGYTGSPGKEATANSVRKLRQSLKMFAISFDTYGAKYISEIYGLDNFVIVEKGAELLQQLSFLVKVIAKSI